MQNEVILALSFTHFTLPYERWKEKNCSVTVLAWSPKTTLLSPNLHEGYIYKSIEKTWKTHRWIWSWKPGKLRSQVSAPPNNKF